MPIIDAIIPQFEREAVSTRKVLERIPADKYGWKPHDKSMTMGRLAGHTAEISEWVVATLEKDALVMNPGEYKPYVPESTEALLKKFDDAQAKGLEAMKGVTDAHLMESWSLKMGDRTIFSMPRIAVIRTWVMNHTYHHRGQLTVYLRLNDLPVPAIYGPSADETQGF